MTPERDAPSFLLDANASDGDGEDTSPPLTDKERTRDESTNEKEPEEKNEKDVGKRDRVERILETTASSAHLCHRLRVPAALSKAIKYSKSITIIESLDDLAAQITTPPVAFVKTYTFLRSRLEDRIRIGEDSSRSISLGSISPLLMVGHKAKTSP